MSNANFSFGIVAYATFLSSLIISFGIFAYLIGNKNNKKMENKLSIYKFAEKLKIKSLVEKIISNIDNQKVKGENGVVGVIGGSFEYTGAPYYSAISALKTGSDLSHVFCHTEAAIPIKSYSPELIVHPGFDNDIDNIALLDKTSRWFKSMDTLVIGPGLGREESVLSIINHFLKVSLKIKNLAHVIDADGLWHFMNSNINELIAEDSLLILTPNKTEFARLYNKVFNTQEESIEDKIKIIYDNIIIEKNEVIIFENLNEIEEEMVYFNKEIKLANALKNKVILKKGKYDIITNGKSLILVGNEGSLKRCGGIGDILNGIIATFCSMKKKQTQINQFGQLKSHDLLEICALACFVCREASRSAYEKRGYSLTAPDVIHELSNIAINYKF